MPRQLTPAERIADASKTIRLEEIADQSSWDRFLVEQAAFHYGTRHRTFSANDLRDVLPDLAHGYLGAAIGSLHAGGLIQHTGRVVPSTLESTHGHRIAVWKLSSKGRRIASRRAAARRETAA